jgi:hypothetical protein
MAFPLCEGFLVCREHVQMGLLLVLSVMLLNKHYIKLYTTSFDVLWWSVATSFHSTPIFNIHCKYVQTISIHHREVLYVERQADSTA